ncbi:hypothetical protein JL09_g7068, partial [Pichia kudriavzevii]
PIGDAIADKRPFALSGEIEE